LARFSIVRKKGLDLAKEVGRVRVSFVVAQTPVTWDVDANLAQVREVTASSQAGDVLVFPEGMLSGYAEDLTPLSELSPARVHDAVAEIGRLAQEAGVDIFCGSLLPVAEGWANAGLHFSPSGEQQVYRKINLAMNERGPLVAGSELPAFAVAAGMVAVQLCREIRFPEQWQYLAAEGAKAFVYMTNAAGPHAVPGVWRSHLVSRAAENQRFVVSANVAHPDQFCPSMVISPQGEVLAELPMGAPGVLRQEVELNEAGSWYLDQRRRDVVAVDYRADQVRPGSA
jgi:predicted amidohydrolase